MYNSMDRIFLDWITSAEAGGRISGDYVLGAYVIDACLLSTWFIYVIMLKWCCQIWTHDEYKSARFYAEENMYNDGHTYALIIQTGYSRNSGTTSTVSVTIKGDQATSNVCMLSADLGNVEEIVFEAVPEGPFPDWRLSRVDLWDMTHMKHYVFLEGYVLPFSRHYRHRILPLVNLHLPPVRSMLRRYRLARALRLFHLQFSVLDFPYGTRYTRVQRLTSVLFLALWSMFIDVTLYGFYPPRDRGLRVRSIVPNACYISVCVFFLTIFVQVLFEVFYQDAHRDEWGKPFDLDNNCSRPIQVTGGETESSTGNEPEPSPPAYRYCRNKDIQIFTDPSNVQHSAGGVPVVDDDVFVAFADGIRLSSCYPPLEFRFVPWIFVAVSCISLSATLASNGHHYGTGASLSWAFSLALSVLLTCFVIEPLKAVLIATVTRHY